MKERRERIESLGLFMDDMRVSHAGAQGVELGINIYS